MVPCSVNVWIYLVDNLATFLVMLYGIREALQNDGCNTCSLSSIEELMIKTKAINSENFCIIIANAIILFIILITIIIIDASHIMIIRLSED